jgi:uncharacterized protein YjdB
MLSHVPGKRRSFRPFLIIATPEVTLPSLRWSALFAFILVLVPVLSTRAQTTGPTFTESFGNSSNVCWSGGPSSCNQLWVAVGSTQSIVATPGSPPPNTAGANSLQMVEPAGSANYIYTTGTFPRIPAGSTFDLYFTLDVSSQGMKPYDLTRLITPSTYADGSDYLAQISFGYDGTNFQLQAGGASFASKVNISLNAWHTVQLHLAAGTNASFMVVDGGAQNTFTENPRDFAYMVVGSAGGNFDALTYYIGNVYVNSALGGGPPPSAYIDFENSTDGTTIDTGILAASTHCGNGVWSLTTSPITGMTISADAQKQLPSPVTTCGTQYSDATGTRGLRYDISQTGRYAAYNWSSTSNSASVGFFYKITVSDTNYYSVFNINGRSGLDYAALNVHDGAMRLEVGSQISSAPINISPNTWYWVTMQYNAGGTHHLQAYDTTSWTLLGDLSNGATGNDSPGGISMGRTGSETGYPSAYWYYDNIIVDYLTAKFPIVPGAPKNLVSIAVTPVNPSIAKGSKQQFTATGTYSDGSTQDLSSTATWSSSNASVATISGTGLATGVGAGTSTIQAASGSVSSSTSLTVTGAVPTSIAVTPANPSIATGATQQFTATGSYSDGSTQNLTNSVTWSSSNTSVAMISSAGLASGVGTGSSTIQAASGSVTGSTTLNVTGAVLTSIAVTPANPSITKGATQQFTATGTYSDGSSQNLTNSVTWRSLNTSVATVSSTGLASTAGSGSSTIQAASGSVTGSTTLTVTATAVLSSITVTPANPSIRRGATQQFTAIGSYSDGSTKNLTNSVTWSSSNTSVATISGTGLARAVGVGTSTIRATSGTVSGSTLLTVRPRND